MVQYNPAKSFYRSVLRSVREMPKDQQWYYRHHCRGQIQSHSDETNIERLKHFIEIGLKSHIFLLKKYNLEEKNMKNTLRVKSDAYLLDLWKQIEILMLEAVSRESNDKKKAFQIINESDESFPILSNENEAEDEEMEGIDAIFRKK